MTRLAEISILILPYASGTRAMGSIRGEYRLNIYSTDSQQSKETLSAVFTLVKSSSSSSRLLKSYLRIVWIQARLA